MYFKTKNSISVNNGNLLLGANTYIKSDGEGNYYYLDSGSKRESRLQLSADYINNNFFLETVEKEDYESKKSKIVSTKPVTPPEKVSIRESSYKVNYSTYDNILGSKLKLSNSKNLDTFSTEDSSYNYSPKFSKKEAHTIKLETDDSVKEEKPSYNVSNFNPDTMSLAIEESPSYKNSGVGVLGKLRGIDNKEDILLYIESITSEENVKKLLNNVELILDLQDFNEKEESYIKETLHEKSKMIRREIRV